MTKTQRVATWVAVTVLSVTGSLVPVASAQEAPVSARPQAAKPAGGMGEGIKVHGRWTIEVRNRDGALASRHEFENALSGVGPQVLAGLLARDYYGVRQWEINLSTPQPACQLDETGCRILEFIGTGTPPPHSLDVGLARTKGGNSGFVELRGTARFVFTGAISAVSTAVSLCASNGCAEATIPRAFTSHALATPIPVAAGQLVEVFVYLSFS